MPSALRVSGKVLAAGTSRKHRRLSALPLTFSDHSPRVGIEVMCPRQVGAVPGRTARRSVPATFATQVLARSRPGFHRDACRYLGPETAGPGIPLPEAVHLCGGRGGTHPDLPGAGPHLTRSRSWRGHRENRLPSDRDHRTQVASRRSNGTGPSLRATFLTDGTGTLPKHCEPVVHLHTNRSRRQPPAKTASPMPCRHHRVPIAARWRRTSPSTTGPPAEDFPQANLGHALAGRRIL